MKNEQEKSEAFERLAVKRMNKYIKAARLVANLGNKNNYKGTSEQKIKIVQCAKAEIVNLEKALTTGDVQPEGFQF